MGVTLTDVPRGDSLVKGSQPSQQPSAILGVVGLASSGRCFTHELREPAGRIGHERLE